VSTVPPEDGGDEATDAVAADEPAEPEALDEVREAAGAVLVSLKRLLDAAERAIEDPSSFDRMVSSGRGLVEAFTAGLASEPSGPHGDDERDETPEGA
jgi:hypothetical protein